MTQSPVTQRAMIIDDSRAMRSILRRIIQSLDFETAEAGHGQEALDQMEGGFAPDLCLIDWNMPVMDGYTFITEVRKRPEWRNITLMMVTTESEQGQIVKALAAGAHEYVIKPFTPDAIVEKLELLGLVSKGVPA
ncbi:response regulator [Nocardioides sp. BP30]|uniref:response regulator n=1 Tax=Nocardioides sp. BP30 TaxID=3036374 RepID=UPI002469939C|nr:response regulator [Nocardioides sp. BP30]WGL51926.1 response regulator [Nocardioides sp. BP30]